MLPNQIGRYRFIHVGHFRSLLLTCVFLSPLVQAQIGEQTFVPGEVLIRYTVNASDAQISALEQTNNLILLKEFPHLRTRHYRLPAQLSVLSAIELLRGDPIIDVIEPNYYRRPLGIPADPKYIEQWALNNTGQVVNGLAGTFDSDIDWPEAIDLYTGTQPITVAVLDSGVALDHPEINPNIWVNSGEPAPANGVDDDGNGYIDDVIGWDFYDNDSLPLDENGHGTLVASLIGAVTNNNDGMAGIAPNVRIMSLRVLNDFGVSALGLVSSANFLAATTYAAVNGARIINASFGGGSYSSIEDAQIAWLDTQGVLLVVAAGNGGPDLIGDDNDATPFYPASYNEQNVISVAASDADDNLTLFSNYGVTSVDLSAPGKNIVGADLKRSRLYFENFEGGGVGWTQGHEPDSQSSFNWSTFADVTGNTWLTDSVGLFGNAVNYLPNTDSWAKSPLISLGIGPQLTYKIWYDLEWFFDGLLVEVSADQINWFIVDFVTGSSLGFWTNRAVDLSGLDGQSGFLRFRLITDSSTQFDGVYIDNIALTNVDIFQYDGSQYRYDKGTSFAAPMVSGVAALLMSQRPDLSHRQIRQIILDNVDPIPPLSGKIVTGGRLNALKALQGALNAPRSPIFSSAGIVNAASYQSPGAVTPGALVALFGTDLAATTQLAGNVPLPTTLGGATVTIGGVMAPLVYASPTQINLQIPWQVTGMSNPAMTVQTSTTSTPVNLSVLSAQPGIFTTDQSGSGQGAILIANSSSLAAPVGAFPGSQPVQRREFIEIFCTGLGPVNNPPPTGAATPDAGSTLVFPPTVTIGGVTAPVSFAGLAPGFVALYQVNVQIPQNAPAGNAVSLVLFAGVNANTVTLAVQ